MAYGEAAVVIRRPPHEIIDFVMDLRRYRSVDEKLGTIHSVRDAPDGRGRLVTFTPRLMGVPGLRTTQHVVPEGHHISICGVPAWTDALLTFEASFRCEATAAGTVVTRALDFRFAKPLSWFVDPLFDRWLRTAIPRELHRAKAYLEAGHHRI